MLYGMNKRAKQDQLMTNLEKREVSKEKGSLQEHGWQVFNGKGCSSGECFNWKSD